jgi:hypothetical protein
MNGEGFHSQFTTLATARSAGVHHSQFYRQKIVDAKG